MDNLLLLLIHFSSQNSMLSMAFHHCNQNSNLLLLNNQSIIAQIRKVGFQLLS